MRCDVPLPRQAAFLLLLLLPAGTGCQQPPPPPPTAACDPGNGGLTLPEGFCAAVFADSVGPGRHLDVGPEGTVYLALRNRNTATGETIRGGVAVLRDLDGDGRADERRRVGENGGNEVLLSGEYLYFATDDAVLRYRLRPGDGLPEEPADTLVFGLPATQNHRAKSLAITPNGDLYVNIGAPSNACQERPRAVGVPGIDPCPQLKDRAGIWRFRSDRLRQAQADGERFATGLRNTVALRAHPSGALFGVVHGRDQLGALWPELFTPKESAEKPAEEFVRIEEGDDYGWPYCYFDPETNKKVLAPEYGGDGTAIGRCAEKKDPLVGFPAHWAPNDLEFYTGTQFPPFYRGGAFIAFHGSWNRAPEPQAGYNVVFLPFSEGEIGDEWMVFADGFAGEDVSPRGAAFRPVGLATGSDGSLYISDSQVGRIWRVVWVGSQPNESGPEGPQPGNRPL